MSNKIKTNKKQNQKNIILYHFTSRHHVNYCFDNGIFMGKLPFCVDPVDLRPGYQWLTTNPDFDQSWNQGSSLPYDRTDYRLTIKIPAKYADKLLKFTTDIKRIIPKEMYDTLSYADIPEFDDHESWYCFKGSVKAKWIKKCDKNPGFKERS